MRFNELIKQGFVPLVNYAFKRSQPTNVKMAMRRNLTGYRESVRNYKRILEANEFALNNGGGWLAGLNKAILMVPPDRSQLPCVFDNRDSEADPDESAVSFTRTFATIKPRFVYLLTDGEFHKIGFTTGKPSTRLAALQTGSSRELKLVCEFKGDKEDEARLHELFSPKNVRGEWFDLSREDVEQIRQLFA